MAELIDFILGNDEQYQKTSNVQIETSMLDYDYVSKCKDVCVLKEILRVLKSGKEGKYPHLEHTTASKILELLPVSERKAILSKVDKPSPDVLNNEKSKLIEWIDSIMEKGSLTDSNEENRIFKSGGDVKSETSENQILLPIRGVRIESQDKSSSSKKTKSLELKLNPDVQVTKVKKISKATLSNKEYFEAWDKFDFDAEEQKVEVPQVSPIATHKSKGVNKTSNSLNDTMLSTKARSKDEIDQYRQRMNYDTLTEKERKFFAQREKDKGKEYIQNKEYDTAYCSYTKSLAFDDTNAIVFANRAMVCIRLEKYGQALHDCTEALKIDPTYTKALARRGLVHHKCGRYLEAQEDFSQCLEREPNNKEYARLLKHSSDKYIELLGDSHEKNKKKIMIIEDDSDEESIEEVYTIGARSQ